MTHIRPFVKEDLDNLHVAISESTADLCPWLDWCHPSFNREDTERYLNQLIDETKGPLNRPFGVFNGPLVIGAIGLYHIEPHNRQAAMGYWIRSSMCGQGYAQRAIKLAAAYGFGTLGLQRIEIYMVPTNVRSQRAAERAGAHYEGVARNRIMHQGRSYDARLYSLVPTDHIVHFGSPMENDV